MNNSKLVIFLSCLFAATLTAPLVTAAGHGSGGRSFAGRPGMGPGRPGMGMPGRFGMGCLVALEWGCGAVSTDMFISTITMIISITMRMRTMMSSLSVPSAFHGAGGGVRGGARAIRTDIMVMVARTDTAMAMEMHMDMVVAMVMDTARAAG